MHTIRLLIESAINDKVAIEACGTDSYLKVDGRIKRIDKIHQLAVDRVNHLKNIRSYIGFNIYKNDTLVEIVFFSGYYDFKFKSI